MSEENVSFKVYFASLSTLEATGPFVCVCVCVWLMRTVCMYIQVHLPPRLHQVTHCAGSVLPLCTGVTRRWRLLSHARNAVRKPALSYLMYNMQTLSEPYCLFLGSVYYNVVSVVNLEHLPTRIVKFFPLQ